METVVQFPDKLERYLTAIRTALLSIVGADPAMVDWIITDLRPRLKNLVAIDDFSFFLPMESVAAAGTQMQDLAAKLQQHANNLVNTLVMEMLLIEIDLYFARGSRPPGAGFAEKVRLSGLSLGVIEGGKQKDD